jgi:23S rRNA pseudouridine1911/1915/1917 synthase
MKIIITQKENNIRLDKAMAQLLSDYSRAKIQKLIEQDKVFVNDKLEKASYKVSEGDVVSFIEEIENHSTLKEEDIPLDVIYEDDDVAVINKPAGMVVHPGNGNYEHTLANALLHRFSKLSDVNGSFRPGIVHRIDKDTSGLLLVAKTDFAHQKLSEDIQKHLVVRKYYALLKGEIEENKGKIVAPIARDHSNRIKMGIDLVNGKEAITHFNVLKRYVGYTFVECILETGRTHQIRVHMNYIGHPVIGDPLYGKNNKDIYKEGQLLHAHEISFTHPRTNKVMTFSCDLPQYFKDVLSLLKERK